MPSVEVNVSLKEKMCDRLIEPKIIKEGNYMPSGHNAGSIISKEGIAPTVMENHGTVTAIIEKEPTYYFGTYDYQKSDKFMKGKNREKLGNDTMSCVKTNGTDDEIITNQLRIRKLTPRECWRLMGFSDEQFDKVEGKISNTQLYKQAGNSIVVDVLYHIFKELFINQKDRHLYIEPINDTTSKEEEKLW